MFKNITFNRNNFERWALESTAAVTTVAVTLAALFTYQFEAEWENAAREVDSYVTTKTAHWQPQPLKEIWHSTGPHGIKWSARAPSKVPEVPLVGQISTVCMNITIANYGLAWGSSFKRWMLNHMWHEAEMTYCAEPGRAYQLTKAIIKPPVASPY